MPGCLSEDSSGPPFWKAMAEAWCQDQLTQVSLQWKQCVTSCPPSATPPTPPLSLWEASMGAATATPQIYNVVSVAAPLTTATARHSHSNLALSLEASIPNGTLKRWPPWLWKALEEGTNNPDRTSSSTTSLKMMKKLRFPSTPLKKTREHQSRWRRYVTEEERVARQTAEDKFREVAAGMTCLGPRSARCVVPYPPPLAALTAT